MDSAYPNCRFYVQIAGASQAVFSEVSGLQVEMEVFEYQQGGQNSFVHKLPGRTKVSNLTLKRGMTQSNELLKWYSEVLKGKVKRQNVTVLVYDPKGTRMATLNFERAYPVKWIGPQLQAEGHAVAVETLELAHDGMSIG